MRHGHGEGKGSCFKASLPDIRLNVIGNRFNMTVKRLTVVATLFMPATFPAGLYGTNNVHMPENH